jgi:hypothetical protein
MFGRERLRATLLSLSATCALLVSFSNAAFAANAFDLGREEFKLKRFHAAKAQFMTAVTENPSNQKAYLYLGRCLEYLKEPEDAQATYRACYSVNPFSEDGKRAKQFSMDVAGRLEAADHRAVDSPKTVIDSGLLIQRQALDLQARKIREMNEYAKNRRNVSRRQGYFYTNADLVRRPPGSDVSDPDFIRNSGMIYNAQIESTRAKAHGQHLAQNVQDTANALIERLGRKTNSSSPALRALGTNLYVQYFRSQSQEEDIPPPPDPPIELRAKQLQFTDIPRAWRAQSKIFKFPTINQQELLQTSTGSSTPRPSTPGSSVSTRTDGEPPVVLPNFEEVIEQTYGSNKPSAASSGNENADNNQTDGSSNAGVNESLKNADSNHDGTAGAKQPAYVKEPKPFNWSP